jgi:hypothetical protein
MLLDKITHNGFLYRFSALNIFGFGLLLAALHQGWIGLIAQTDTTRITWLIAAVFMIGLGVSIWKAIGLNRVGNHIHGLAGRMKLPPDTIGFRLAAEMQIVNHFASVLLLMGIAGTMVGIIIALKSTELFSTSDQSSMVEAIVMLFRGVYVKFYASLVGITGHLWLLTNYNMLSTMCRRILASYQEQYVRPVQ